MVSDRTMRAVLRYSTPFILENLASIDFLNNNVSKVDGKTPFYDDQSQFAAMASKRGKKEYVSKRPTIHLKDSWMLRISSSGGIGIVRLSNAKRSGDGRWNIADLLWYGTHDYNIDAPDVSMRVPVFYKEAIFSAVPGVGRTQAEAIKNLRKYRGKDYIDQLVNKGHHTGAMSFYNRYLGKMQWNRHFRRGIRNELVQTFKRYILLCVENGIRTGLTRMEEEGLLRSAITNVSVRIQA
jgi:hypothetical protein